MPDNASALQLVLSGDPALFAIVLCTVVVVTMAVTTRSGRPLHAVVVTAGANLLIAGQTVRRLDEAAK